MGKVLLIIFGILAALFLLSLIIYFLNLDMKLAAAMTPLMNKLYDRSDARRKRRQEAADKHDTGVGKGPRVRSTASRDGVKP